MSSIIFVGFSIPLKDRELCISISRSPQVQTLNFSSSIVRALSRSFDSVLNISTFPVQDYPKVKKVFFKQRKVTGKIKTYIIPFINLPVLKHVTRFISTLFLVASRILSDRPVFLFVHGLHLPFILVGVLSRIFGVKLVVIITDLPSVMLADDGKCRRFLKSFEAFLIRKVITFADFTICLSATLVRELNIQKPTMLLPGVLNSEFIDNYKAVSINKEFGDKFVVVYAGGLLESYGVGVMIKAAKASLDKSVLFCFCGVGPLSGNLAKLAAEHSNIEFLGSLGSKDLASIYKRANVLMNCRPADSEIAKSSFPSKLIEYLGTGKPVLTTRIISIPPDLESLFYFIESLDVVTINGAIKDLKEFRQNDHDEIRQVNVVKLNYSEEAVAFKIQQFLNNREENDTYKNV